MAPLPGVPPVTNRAIPIEYPVNPDCMVDDHMVPFKERGLRGKAGSAPPLDLDKGSRGLVRIPGRMGSLIMGHTGPTVGKKKDNSKKFWFQMVYCEFSSMEDLLARLQALRPTNAAEELAKIRRRAAEDDDIEVGTSTLSLKDPVSAAMSRAQTCADNSSCPECVSRNPSDHPNVRICNASTLDGGWNRIETIRSGCARIAARS